MIKYLVCVGHEDSSGMSYKDFRDVKSVLVNDSGALIISHTNGSVAAFANGQWATMTMDEEE